MSRPHGEWPTVIMYGFNHQCTFFESADRDVSPAIVRVNGRDTRRPEWVAPHERHPNDFQLAQVCERMEHADSSDIIHVRRSVRVQENSNGAAL